MTAGNQRIGQCPIWTACNVLLTRDRPGEKAVERSPRTGGNYAITDSAVYDIQDLDERQRAQLTTILVDKRNQGCKWPLVTLELLEQAKNRTPLPDDDRASRLLRYIGKKTESAGDLIAINESTYEAYAWSESIKWSEVHFLLTHLYQNRLIAGLLTETRFEGVITFEGRRYSNQIMNESHTSIRHIGFRTSP